MAEKQEEDMATANFLVKAAALFLNTGQPDTSSHFIRNFEDQRMADECRTALHGPMNSPRSAIRSTPSKQKGLISLQAEFPRAYCKLCGQLQNPLFQKFRIRPRIRKKSRVDSDQRKGNVGNVENDKGNVNKSLKFARKFPFVSSKCQYCKHVERLVCQPPPVVKDKTQNKGLKATKCHARRNRDAYGREVFCKKAQCKADTPESNLTKLSRSSRKKNRSRDSPLAKLLSTQRQKAATSPSLKSFLLNSVN